MADAADGVLVGLVNPTAGGGRARRTAHALRDALAAAGGDAATVHWIETDSADQVRHQARDAARGGARALLVVGGDGTVHHAVRGLLDAPAPIPLALCAAGTGNDFVKNLAYDARSPMAVAATVQRRAIRYVDVGLVNGIPFVNAAGVGFDVDVAERMQRGRSRGGRVRYLWHAGRALIGYRGFRAAWDTDAEPAHRLMMVFANGHTFGGSFRIAPDARPDDGHLDAVVIGDVPPLARPRLFLDAIRGRHVRDPRVRVQAGTAFRLAAAAPLTIECDGELYPLDTHRLDVSLRPGALPLLD